MTEDRIDSIMGAVSDVVAVVSVAGLLAFVALVWSRAGSEPASGIAFMFGVSYMVGRHHSTRVWFRLLPAIKAKWERDRE